MEKIIKQFLVLITGFVFVLTNAQTAPDWAIQTANVPAFVDFSPSDKYLVLENELGYEVWNTQSQLQVLHGKYRNKVGHYYSEAFLTEGSAYLLFEHEDIFLQIDYTLNQAKVKAYDLKTKEMVWEITNLDIGVSTAQAVFQLIGMINRVSKDKQALDEASGNYLSGQALSKMTGRQVSPLARSRRGNYFSYIGNDKTINKLITYLPEKNAIAVNGKDGLQLISLKNGETLWHQPDLAGGIGEVFYEPQNNLLIAVRVNQSELQNIMGKPEVQALEVETGNLQWSLEYYGDFLPETAFVVGETLVLPYFGLSFIDVKTGEEREGDVKEAMKKQRRIYRNMSILGAGGDDDRRLGDNCSYPFLDENDVLHYVVGMSGGKNINPDGGKKSYLQIDIHKDKILLNEEKIAKQGNRIIQEEMIDGILYLKMTKGLSSSFIMGIDTSSGKVIFETEKVSNRLGTDFDLFLLEDNRIVDASSKGIHTYDAKTGQELSVISYKDIQVGKFRNQLIFDHGLILFGTKGVAITNDEGEVKATFSDMNRIQDFRIGEEIWLVEKKRFTRIGTQPIKILEEIPFRKREMVFFSPSGNYFLKLDETGKNINLYNL
ncbi:MAG: PQQ-like beta-propeller repeat protein [Flavobacteriaceae bacterium]|nr:PQQ-like beta-propeller repeat protein [Flavobacteriaceae bacterium]